MAQLIVEGSEDQDEVIDSSDDVKPREEYVFHRKDKNMLNILGVYFSGAILPQVEYHLEDMGGDPEFDKFRSNAITNSEIFYHFARFMVRNYIFIQSSRNARSRSKF